MAGPEGVAISTPTGSDKPHTLGSKTPATPRTLTPAEAGWRLEEAADDGRLGELAAEHRLALIVVFGSVAERVDDPQDLDIAVEPTGPIDRVALYEDLVELVGTSHIDVMDLTRAGTVARHEALSYGYPVHEADEGRFADAQMVATTTWMDSRWLRDLDLRALADR